MPLARFAKEEKGISAVYIGGLIQLLFGLTGRRYLERLVVNGRLDKGGVDSSLRGDDNRIMETLNEHWMPPLDSETPSNFWEQERGAYW